jgi:sugar lactone lactonase YvrE
MHKITLIALLLMTPLLASAQDVSTLVSSINASGGVRFGPDGNIYIADFGDRLNNANGTTVYKVTPEGAVSVFSTGFSGASGNDFDASGNLIQANISASRIDQITPAGVRTTIASSGLQGPVGVTVASDGDIFVANCGGNSISRISAGVVSSFVVGQGLSCPNGITVDPDDNLYVVNFNDGKIFKISPQGALSLLATTPGTAFRPGGGNGHIVYGNGRMYLTSNANSQIFEMTLDGELSVLAGSGVQGNQDGPAEEATFSLPNGIAISPDERFLYVNTAQFTTTGALNGTTFELNPSLLRVIDLGVSFNMNAGLNDAWFNPLTDGQGFFITVFPNIGFVSLAWFTYDTELPDAGDTANLGDPGHRWLTALGSIEGNKSMMDISVASGGIFDTSTDIDRIGDGTIILTFSDCNSGTVEYDIPSIGQTGTVPIQRVADDNIALCLALSAD